MKAYLVADGPAVGITAIAKADFPTWLKAQTGARAAWVRANGFHADAGSICLIPGDGGEIAQVILGLGAGDDPWVWAGLPAKLPDGTYRIDGDVTDFDPTWIAVAWMLGTYGYDRYKSKNGRKYAKLVWPIDADRERATAMVEAHGLVRDLINTPAADLGPHELGEAAQRVAAQFDAAITLVVGDDLLTGNYPAIYAVGKGAGKGRKPRLIDLVWGDAAHPKVTLVGKGVCFDSGGLDIKPSSGMKLMKKDMGGAAHVLGLATLIMAAKLPVRLRVLIPAVENSVSAEAMRPLDVLKTRKGLTVEVGNTDAEGRLILADALWEAGCDKPELLIDFATLTGAARTALGPDLPALFSNDDTLAADLLAAGTASHDPLWRLPLFAPYRRLIDSKVADLCNSGDSPHAGAITAALFLNEFVPPGVAWAHFDILAWNGAARPGRPDGGEAMGLRAVFEVLRRRYNCE